MISSILLATAIAAQPALPQLVSHACELGVVQPWSTASCNVLIENESDQDIVFSRTAFKASNTFIDNLPIRVPARGRTTAHLLLHVRGRLGKFAVGAGLASKGFPGKALRVSAHGFSYSKLDVAGSRLDFGKIRAGQRSGQELSLASTDDPSLHATRVLECPAFLQCRLDPNGRRLTVAVSADAHWGLQSGSVTVALSSESESKAEFQASADIIGKIHPDKNPLSIGMRSAGETAVIPLQLSSASGTGFRVGKVTLDGLQGSVSTRACKPSAAGCQALDLHVSADQPPGFVSGKMSIQIPDIDQVLDVGITGILTRPAPKSEPGAADRPGATGAEAKDQQDQGGKSFRHTRETGHEALTLAPPEPPGLGPVLRWSVANEQPLYGYLIYRAVHKDGPWQRVNDQIIPVLGHDDAASQYAWRDTSAVKGQTYWYFIKSLANNGRKEKLTEAQKVVAH